MHKLFAVAGKPILHSKSPQMFNAAFKDTGINAKYTRICSDNAFEAMKTFKEIGFSGMNVTAPLKEEITGYMDYLHESAKKIGAVNTVVLKGKKLYGFNTDHLGVVFALKKNGVKIKGEKAVVIGAGGAGKAAAFGLYSSGAKVVIANRTHNKALKAAERIGCTAIAFEKISKEIRDADILVSCIPAKKALTDFSCLHKDLVVLDANYAFESELAIKAKQKGCKVIDGRQWLVFQAAMSFGLFTGKKAPVSLMMKQAFSTQKTQNKNIALVGFMGSGKTSAGRKLAELSSKKNFDMDSEIEKSQGKKIKKIFHEKGEEFFRKIEKKELRKISNKKNLVVSCGGGIVLDESNAAILNKKFKTFWLWTSVKETRERTKSDFSRPLLLNAKKENAVQKLLDKRLYSYAIASHAIIDTSNKKPSQVAEVILGEID